MSGFPGTPSWSEVESAKLRADLEQERSDAMWPTVERSDEDYGVLDRLWYRINDLKAQRADMMTDEYLRKVVVDLEEALGEIERLHNEISQLRKQIRKEGSNEAQ